MSKKLFTALFVALFLTFFAAEGIMAGQKNPCAANPCEMKNACGKNPCATNPCAVNPCAAKVKKIRKAAVRDMADASKKAEMLWNNPKLGTSGMSCATCHADGKGLKKEGFPKYIKMADDVLTTDQMINFCMTNPMKGKPLAWNSTVMTYLAAYVSTHSSEEGASMNPCAANPCSMGNPCGKKDSHKNPCAMKHTH